MAQEIKMSASGLKAMQDELEYLKTVRRKELAEDQNRQPWLVDRMLSKLANAAGKADKA